MKKREWRWRGKKRRNGREEAHIKERIKRAATIMGEVWGIGKRKFGKDWNRKLWLFDKLI